MAAAADRLVTPEAVVLEFETASIGTRLLAGLIDGGVQFVLLVGVILGVGLLDTITGSFGGIAVALLFLLYFLVLFGYPAGMETLWNGRTLGKAALGLRVVTVDGAPERFRHAAIRSVLGLVDFYFSSGAVAVLFVLFTRRNQRLGDLLAGTIVLRERSGGGRPAPVHFPPPPGLEGFVANLDVLSLRHDEYATIRSFLVRSRTMAPAVRDNLARQVATPVASRLRIAVPPGITAETFLACVAAAFQARTASDVVRVPTSVSVWATLDAGTAAPPASPTTAPTTLSAGETPAAAGGFVPPG